MKLHPGAVEHHELSSCIKVPSRGHPCKALSQSTVKLEDGGGNHVFQVSMEVL